MAGEIENTSAKGVEVSVVAQEESVIKVPDDALKLLKNLMVMLRPTIMRIVKMLETPEEAKVDFGNIAINDLRMDNCGDLIIIIKNAQGRLSKIKLPQEELNKILGVIKNE
jgi:hypothetical protein